MQEVTRALQQWLLENMETSLLMSLHSTASKKLTAAWFGFLGFLASVLAEIKRHNPVIPETVGGAVENDLVAMDKLLSALEEQKADLGLRKPRGINVDLAAVSI